MLFRSEGFLVGFRLGRRGVGLFVGFDVGFFVGFIVGFLLGLFVGLAGVGLDEGFIVGLNEPQRPTVLISVTGRPIGGFISNVEWVTREPSHRNKESC